MQFKKWLILTESKEEKALALELAGDEVVIKHLQEVIPQNKKYTDPILVLAAYYYNQNKNLDQIKNDIKDYIKLLNNNKMELIIVDPITKKPKVDYIKWTQIIHGHQSEADAKERKSYVPKEIDLQNEKPIATSPDGSIKIYKANSPQQCIILGKGHSFCISQPGNTMWQSYRDSQASTFYFVKDSSRNDSLSTVVVDMTEQGPELTDVNNDTGNTTDPFTKEITSSTEPYFRYLKQKGIDTVKLFKNIPKTEQEEKEQEKLGTSNARLKWFINLSHDEKSKYIGRGHVLSDKQFDYLWNNNFNSLLEQYVKTGLALNDYQLSKIASNSDLRKNYIHNRIITQRHYFNIKNQEWKMLSKKQKEDVLELIKDNEYAMNQAAEAGNLELVKYLVDDKGKNIGDTEYLEDENGNNTVYGVLDNAAKSGNLELVKYLVDDKGKNIVMSNLDNAADSGNLELVKYLVDKLEKKGASIRGEEVHAVGNAARSGNLNILKYLVDEKGIKLGSYILVQAARSGNLDILKYLVDKLEKKDVRIVDQEVYDALVYAKTQDIKDYLRGVLENRRKQP